MLAVIVLIGLPRLDTEVVLYGLAVGVMWMGALVFIYRALAIGPIAVVTPIIAGHVAFALAFIVVILGEPVTIGQAVAMTIAAIGVIVASADPRRGVALQPRGSGVPLALIAMVLAALSAIIFIFAVRITDPLALLGVERVGSALAVVAWASVQRFDLRPLAEGKAFALVATIGLLDVGGSLLFALGASVGYASFVTAGYGAYPIIPALLAITLLKERLAPSQYVGVAAVIVGLVGLGIQT